MPLDRRGFLRTAAGAIPLFALAERIRAEPPAVPARIVRMSQPENLESNFAALDGFRTPTNSFYVRDHFAKPKVDLGAWRLSVGGVVARPLELSLADIQKLEHKTMPVTLECTGNGRVFLTPAARGVNWELGAVGTADWTGVPLAVLLERAGVKPGAVDIVLQGADSGTPEGAPGSIPFARSIPLAKAMKPEVLLAFGMNGKELPAAHGSPLRAIVGGWYGMANVKWLRRILVLDKPFNGFWQTMDYSYFERTSGLPTLVPLSAMQVKAQIARPTTGQTIPAGQPFRVTGAAWAGEAEVTKVEVSTDGGKTWADAKFGVEQAPFCWRLWHFEWKSPPAGKARLLARATDSQGRTQPMERNPDFRNYMICHVLPVDVEVR
jgi:DMSO/TMAO reductase YedYZ molybdopterin-dependent catalytic subunit